MPYLPADPPLSAADLVGMKGSLDGRGTEGWLPGRVEFFGSGRAALLAALHAVGVGSGEDVLLPSYLCESVVSPSKALGRDLSSTLLAAICGPIWRRSRRPSAHIHGR